MSVFISSINSGSNGNCYYVGTSDEAVLIDAGLSCRETEMRMSRVGLQMSRVKALFISHEHSDHIRGTEVLARKFKLPVYISSGTYQNSKLQIQAELLNHFDAYAPISIGELTVNAFPKQHDASEPHSFTVTAHGITIGIMTDIGAVCQHVQYNFSQCHAAFLEANYDEDMLARGRYPEFLKQRIRGEHGHLSNLQSLELFLKHKPDFMSHLLLSHLSQDNNNPHLVHDLFLKHAGDTQIAVASRHKESKVFQITGRKIVSRKPRTVINDANATQLKLF